MTYREDLEEAQTELANYRELIAAAKAGVTLSEMQLIYAKWMYRNQHCNLVHTAEALKCDRRTLQRMGVGR